MKDYRIVDFTALKQQLNELKALFDQKLHMGEQFEDVKKVYLQIKDLDNRLKSGREEQNEL